MKKLQLFVLQFCATSEFHSALELQWHTCKNAHSHWYPWRMSPVRSGAMECGILGTQLPLPTAAPAAPTAFGDGPPVNRKGSLAGFQQTSSPHNPHAFPKMPLLLLQRFQLFCGSSGGGRHSAGSILLPSMLISSNIRLLIPHWNNILLQPSRQAESAAMAIVTAGSLHTNLTFC